MEMDKVSAQIVRAAAGDEPAVGTMPRKQADASAADHWTQPVLMERGAHLRELARVGDGEASETLRQFPQHRAMLSFRSRDGEVEVHEKWADMFFVLSGRPPWSPAVPFAERA